MYANLRRVPELAHNDSSSGFHFPGNHHLLFPLIQSKCNLVVLPKGSCRAGFAFVCMLTFHILDPGTPCSSLQTFQLQSQPLTHINVGASHFELMPTYSCLLVVSSKGACMVLRP